jgi:hypothetical protein
MLKRFLAAIGLTAATAVAAAPPYAPYKDAAADAIYNLLFCDDLSAFLAKGTEIPAPWQVLFASDRPDANELRALALDPNQEGRVRALAFTRLRSLGEEVPKGVLLGVITEVGLDGGLDTLAAFLEGGIRYVNQSGKMVIVEDKLDATSDVLPKLFAAAKDAVNQLKPLSGSRWAPPARGIVRFTFLTSEGLYVGQGPVSAMQRDLMGAPILQAATELLLVVIKLGTK